MFTIPTHTYRIILKRRQTKPSDITGPDSTLRCSIHHWSTHGIAARAILLDYYHYHTTTHDNTPYDPYTTYGIPLSSLHACARAQGLDPRPESQGGDIKPGDILMIRSGFVERYNTAESNAAIQRGQFAGVLQEEPMLDWLHDCYFAGVVGDSPTFECWPPPPPRQKQGKGKEYLHLHQSILALWGMPLGEMWDLERVSGRCRELGRWVFFVTSAPANVRGMFFPFPCLSLGLQCGWLWFGW